MAPTVTARNIELNCRDKAAVCRYTRDKSMLVATNVSSTNMFCRDKLQTFCRDKKKKCLDKTRLLSQQGYACCDKHVLVVKKYLSRQKCPDKRRVLSRQIFFCRYKTFVICRHKICLLTKRMTLVAAPANDTPPPPPLLLLILYPSASLCFRLNKKRNPASSVQFCDCPPASALCLSAQFLENRHHAPLHPPLALHARARAHARAHTHTHAHTHTYIYIYMCVCVCIYIYICPRPAEYLKVTHPQRHRGCGIVCGISKSNTPSKTQRLWHRVRNI